MQLNYRKKDNGILILSRNDVDHIATDILQEYSPNNLKNPIPLDTLSFLENYLGLSVKYRNIGAPGSGILGLTVLNDFAEIPSYDDMFCPCILEESYGTVLINRSLLINGQQPRKRYTEMHEGAHFILHSDYYRKAEKTVINNKALPERAPCCRLETYLPAPKNDSEWMEWQADSLAAALLMPKDPFYSYTYDYIKKEGISRGYLVAGAYTNKALARDIISAIAEKFNVSFRAAQIRMIHLGLIHENAY